MAESTGLPESAELKTLLDVVEEALAAWEFYPDYEYGSSEALIPSRIMMHMDAAFAAYCASSVQTKV